MSWLAGAPSGADHDTIDTSRDVDDEAARQAYNRMLVALHRRSPLSWRAKGHESLSVV